MSAGNHLIKEGGEEEENSPTFPRCQGLGIEGDTTCHRSADSISGTGTAAEIKAQRPPLSQELRATANITRRGPLEQGTAFFSKASSLLSHVLGAAQRGFDGSRRPHARGEG